MLIDIPLFDRQFILWTATGTLLVTIMLGLITGWQLHTLWGMPLLSLTGLLAVTFLKPVVTPKKFFRALALIILVSSIFVLAYTFSMIKKNSDSSGNFPARNFAAEIEQLWHERYQKPLSYVAGNRYLAGYVLHYGNDKPKVLIDWDPIKSPSINIEQMKKSGAIFLWLLSDGENFPAMVYQKYPELQHIEILTIERHRATNAKSSVKVLIGILPPEKTE
jgi:hypothetical protein